MSYVSRSWFSPDRGTPFDELDTAVARDERSSAREQLDNYPMVALSEMLDDLSDFDEVREFLSWVEDETIWPVAGKLAWS